MHIAVLDTDVPVPAVYSTRGLYSIQFRTLLQAAATGRSSSWVEKSVIMGRNSLGGVLAFLYP